MVEYGELSFKVVRIEPTTQEVLARAGNILIARAAFDVAVSLYQTDEIELRQGSRILGRTAAGRSNGAVVDETLSRLNHHWYYQRFLGHLLGIGGQTGGVTMCDYSLEHLTSRPAKGSTPLFSPIQRVRH
jgi:hypothetical protein